MSEKYYKVKEVADLLNVKQNTVRIWITKGKLNSVKVNGARRIPESEINKIIKE